MTLRKKELKIKNLKLKITSRPVVKNEKFDFWGVFKNFLLVGGDLV